VIQYSKYTTQKIKNTKAIFLLMGQKLKAKKTIDEEAASIFGIFNDPIFKFTVLRVMMTKLVEFATIF
jgi:hypothetical protein